MTQQTMGTFIHQSVCIFDFSGNTVKSFVFALTMILVEVMAVCILPHTDRGLGLEKNK